MQWHGVCATFASDWFRKYAVSALRLGFTLDESFHRFTGFTTASFIPICLPFDDRSCSRILATFRLYQKLNTARDGQYRPCHPFPRIWRREDYFSQQALAPVFKCALRIHFAKCSELHSLPQKSQISAFFYNT